MKRFLTLALLAIPAFAATRGTPAEAKAMLAKAVAHYKKAGRTQAIADFNSGNPPWKDRDLYVWCTTSDGVIRANAGFPTFIGSSASNWRDVTGKSLGKATWGILAKKNSGSIQYQWINPVTRKMEPKVSYFEKVASDMACGVGAYNPPR